MSDARGDRITRLEEAGVTAGLSSVAVADALEALGKDTASAIAGLRKLGSANRRMIKAMAFTLAGLLLCMIGVGFVGYETMAQQQEISTVQDRTSDKVLCPLYGAFLAAKDNPIPDNIKNNPKQIEEREAAFKVIDAGYAELECKEG